MISQLFLASLVSCEIWERANPIHQYLDTRSTFIGGISLYALTPSDNAGTCPTYTQTCSGSCCPDGCCPFGTYCFVNGDYCCPNGKLLFHPYNLKRTALKLLGKTLIAAPMWILPRHAQIAAG